MIYVATYGIYTDTVTLAPDIQPRAVRSRTAHYHIINQWAHHKDAR